MLPEDMMYEIYKRLHRSYMLDMIKNDEIYEGHLEWYWRQSEGMGNDYDEW